MRKIIWMLIAFWLHNGFAATNASCVPAVVKVEGKNILLPGANLGEPAQVYYFKNISEKSLWLDHAVQKASASAGWSSYLRPGHWSAIVVNRKDFVINCAVIMPGNVDYQVCAKVVAICSPTSVLAPSKRKGSYWLVEDKPWGAFITAIDKVTQHPASR